MADTTVQANAKIIKITKSTPETEQLEVFVNSLGLIKKPELYKYNNHIYINSDIIIPLLSVDIKWFEKNSELYVHYIKIKKQIYVNKYGLIKLLAQSKEEVAFKLQDYIFEIIYKLEKHGTVSKSNLTSRDQLNKTISELNVYKATDKHNQVLIKESQDELQQLRCDYSITEMELTNLKNKHTVLQNEHTTLLKKYDDLVDLSKQIIKYIRVKKTKIKDDLRNKMDTLCEDESENSDEDVSQISRASIKAKKSIVNIINNTSSKLTTTSTTGNVVSNINTSTCYLFRDAYSTHDDSGIPVYKWEIKDTMVSGRIVVNGVYYSDFKAFSNDFRLDDMKQSVYDQIWYCDLQISEIHKKIFDLVLNFVPPVSEAFIIELINVFNTC